MDTTLLEMMPSIVESSKALYAYHLIAKNAFPEEKFGGRLAHTCLAIELEHVGKETTSLAMLPPEYHLGFLIRKIYDSGTFLYSYWITKTSIIVKDHFLNDNASRRPHNSRERLEYLANCSQSLLLRNFFLHEGKTFQVDGTRYLDFWADGAVRKVILMLSFKGTLPVAKFVPKIRKAIPTRVFAFAAVLIFHSLHRHVTRGRGLSPVSLQEHRDLYETYCTNLDNLELCAHYGPRIGRHQKDLATVGRNLSGLNDPECYPVLVTLLGDVGE